MSNHIEPSDRTPWPANFPDVISFCTVTERDKMPSFERAKYLKNPNQAKELMVQLRSTPGYKKAIQSLKALVAPGEKVTIVPIHSIELPSDRKVKGKKSGINPLPLEIAMAISDETGWEVDTNVIQTNIVGHTGANALTRFAYPATFAGDVTPQRKYLIVDDHVSMGGTVANCRGHIEKGGGQVIGISSLTTNRGGSCVRLCSRHLNRLTNAENSQTMGCHLSLFEKILGYPVDCLTNPEATQILYCLEEGKRVKKDYNIQTLFDDLIKVRNGTDIEAIRSNKEALTARKLSGSYATHHIPSYLQVNQL